jgi:transcription elongation GreA/GreB family factor
MGVYQVITMVLNILIEVWKLRADPEQAKIRAAYLATKTLNSDLENLDEAIAKDDGAALSAHFEQLSARVRRLQRPPDDYNPSRSGNFSGPW